MRRWLNNGTGTTSSTHLGQRLPGTSPHGFGISIDFQENDGWSTFDWGQPGNRWLLANSKKYGFGNPFPYGTWGESYHFDFQG